MADLPAAIVEWAGRAGGGSVTRAERFVARREAWLVDVTRDDGSVVEAFLRVERSRRAGDPSSLAKEVAIVRALANTEIPVPHVYGSDETLGVALFERLKGRADLPNVPLPQQQAVMRDFIDIVARLHLLDPDALAVPDLVRPASPLDCAMSEVDQLIALHADYLATRYDPLLRYGISWLRRFAPEKVARVSLVQGDTGPVNFMFSGDRVSAVFDWEWGHLGDPIEDLGNIATREFWNPSGGMTGLIDRYVAATGFPVDHHRVRYYCVQQQIRGMIGIHAATEHPNPHEPISWYLAYRYVGDRATCEAIADAMQIPLVPPPLPSGDGSADPLAEAAIYALANDIAPATAGALAAARIRDVEILIQCMDRVARFGAAIDEADRTEAAALMGTSTGTLAETLNELNEAIDSGQLADDQLVSYLYRRAVRREWLYAPCTQLYPDRRWAPL